MDSKIFDCSKCNFTSNTKQSYDRHMLTQKHIKNHNPSVFILTYSCNSCIFTCTNKKYYEQHLSTKKHQDNMLTNKSGIHCIPCNVYLSNKSNYNKHIVTQNHILKSEEQSKTTTDYTCLICAKIYRTQLGLSTHNKECKTVEQVKEDPNLLKMVIEQMSKQNDTIQSLVTKVGNNNGNIDNSRKTFNLQVFLNEDCKDAVNWTDFIQNITVSFDDIDMNSNITDKVIHTICKELDKLGVYKRPIHCTDIKRHKACIKDGNEWKREQEPLMKQGVMKVSGKYQQTLNEWAKKHPGWDEDQELSEKMMDMMNIYIRPPSEDKCINTILKHTVIDHENGTK